MGALDGSAGVFVVSVLSLLIMIGIVILSLLALRRSWTHRIEILESSAQMFPAMLARMDVQEEETQRVRDRVHDLSNEVAVIKGHCDLLTRSKGESAR